MQDFYTSFYSAAPHSPAHHAFCERVYGRDLCQHGFADVEQLDQLLQVTGLCAGQRALDLGCGNGMITEYLSDRSGAHITGLDFILGDDGRGRGAVVGGDGEGGREE